MKIAVCIRRVIDMETRFRITSNGVSVDEAGARFDPHQHQAIASVPSDQPANTILQVLQKGYLIADRVLRPALVTVAASK